jgi:hypothetical protein
MQEINTEHNDQCFYARYLVLITKKVRNHILKCNQAAQKLTFNLSFLSSHHLSCGKETVYIIREWRGSETDIWLFEDKMKFSQFSSQDTNIFMNICVLNRET